MNQRPLPIGTRSQLFLDDYLIAASDGVEVQLHPMTKHPEPVLHAAAPWERPEVGGLWGPVHAHFDPIEQAFKLWYSSMGAYPADRSRRDPTYRCLVTSPDGLNWERPNLGLFEYAGSTRNNIFTDQADVGHGMLDCPEMAGVEPPERRYKAAGWGGFDDRRIAQVNVYFSPDGLRWQPYGGNPVLRGRRLDDTNSAAKLRASPTHDGPPGTPTAKYALVPRMMVELGGWRRRCVGITTSEDDDGGNPFTQWTEPMLALAPDQLDDDMSEARLAAAKPLLLQDHPDDHHCEFYGMLLYPTGDLFLGFAWTYDVACDLTRIGRGNEYAIVDVQLIASRDLVHWQRIGHRQPVLGRGNPDSFDSHMIFYHSLPLTVGDEWWVYYMGFNEGHAAKSCYDDALRRQYRADVRAGRRHFPALGLAKVRRDGFISRDAGLDGGTLTTRLLRPGGASLEVNATVAAGGTITVTMQDEQEQALPGFGAADCTPLTGDSLRHRVQWGDRRGDDRWRERPVRLRFHLRAAALYGFRFTEDAT